MIAKEEFLEPPTLECSSVPKERKFCRLSSAEEIRSSSANIEHKENNESWQGVSFKLKWQPFQQLKFYSSLVAAKKWEWNSSTRSNWWRGREIDGVRRRGNDDLPRRAASSSALPAVPSRWWKARASDWPMWVKETMQISHPIGNTKDNFTDSRVAFPTIFFAFCLVYWIYYMWLTRDWLIPRAVANLHENKWKLKLGIEIEEESTSVYKFDVSPIMYPLV